MTTPILTYRTAGAGVHVDLDRLVASRCLIQANSGGGKSRAIRQLLEETHGRVMHLVIDPEGEFVTLREKFDYIIAAKTGGDAIAAPKYAKRFCRTLVELNASAILDLYDLSLDDRRWYVENFLTELMALPRDLWRPIIVVIDEMHVFAPEAGQARSAEAVTALATQGRKRGFALVGATQRISKLHKDVAAELLNKMIGRTGLDIDVKRAGDELGMGKEERNALKTLAPGEFFVYGPAIANEVAKVKTGDVVTSHPEAGRIGTIAPPPSAKVKAMLARLADLPKEAEQEARTIEEFKREVTSLRTQLTKAQKSGTIVEKPVTVIDQRAIERAVAAAMRQQAGTIKSLRDALSAAMQFIVNITTKNFDVAGVDKAELERAIQSAMAKATQMMDQKLTARTKEIDDLRLNSQRIADKLKRVLEADGQPVVIDVAVTRNEPFSVETPLARANGKSNGVTPRASSRAVATVPLADGVSKAMQRILDGLALFETLGITPVRRINAAFMAGYTENGHFNNMVGALRSAGYLSYPGDGTIELTDEGRAIADSSRNVVNSLEDLHALWLSKVSASEGKLLRVAIDRGTENPISRADLAEETGYTENGHFNNMVGHLRSLGAIRYPGDGTVVATDVLFPEGLR